MSQITEPQVITVDGKSYLGMLVNEKTDAGEVKKIEKAMEIESSEPTKDRMLRWIKRNNLGLLSDISLMGMFSCSTRSFTEDEKIAFEQLLVYMKRAKKVGTSVVENAVVTHLDAHGTLEGYDQ